MQKNQCHWHWHWHWHGKKNNTHAAPLNAALLRDRAPWRHLLALPVTARQARSPSVSPRRPAWRRAEASSSACARPSRQSAPRCTTRTSSAAAASWTCARASAGASLPTMAAMAAVAEEKAALHRERRVLVTYYTYCQHVLRARFVDARHGCEHGFTHASDCSRTICGAASLAAPHCITASTPRL